MTDASRTDARTDLAAALLQEAVFASRARQAAAHALDARAGAAGQCGLGAEAAVELGLTPRGGELFERLWPEGLDAAATGRLREALATWVRRQDALDRDRNHFIKGFRKRHGADKAGWEPDVRNGWDGGLERINTANRAEQREAAEALLAAVG